MACCCLKCVANSCESPLVDVDVDVDVDDGSLSAVELAMASADERAGWEEGGWRKKKANLASQGS